MSVLKPKNASHGEDHRSGLSRLKVLSIIQSHRLSVKFLKGKKSGKYPQRNSSNFFVL